MLVLVQIVSIAGLLTFRHIDAVKPPGYVKPVEIPEKISPKYEYGYNIEDTKGSHGKLETRDGIYALGRYYVQGADSASNVQYYADDWGFHPFIEYGNVGPHSRTRTQLLIGVEAVKALASNKFTAQSVPPKEHVTNTINSKVNSQAAGSSVIEQQPLVAQQPPNVQQPQPQLLVAQQPLSVQQPQAQLLVAQQPPIVQQQIITPQPLILRQQPQLQTVISHQPQIVQQTQPQTLFTPEPQQAIVQQENLLTRQNQLDASERQQAVAIAQEQQRQQQAIITAQEQQIRQQQAESYAQEQQRQQEAIEIAQQQQREQESAAIVQQQQRAQESAAIVQQQQRAQESAAIVQQQQRAQESAAIVQQQQDAAQQQQRQQEASSIAQQQQRQQVAFSIAQQQERQQQQIAQQQQAVAQQAFLRQQNEQINQQQNQQVLIIGQQNQGRFGIESNFIQNNNNQLTDDALSLASQGEFGARINSGSRVQVQRPQTTSRLIETTRNLVNGQDVLNINGAADSVTIEASSIAPSINENFIQSVTEASLLQQPIIVEDFSDRIVSSTTAGPIGLKTKKCDEVFSTTANTLRTVSTNSYDVTEPSSILVTPRPISTNFLAPITAGVQLQNQRVEIDIQKSLPFYLGNFQTRQQSDSISVESAAQSDQQQAQQQQQLPELEVKENFVEIDQQQFPAPYTLVPVQKVERPVTITQVVEKRINVPQPYPVEKIVEKKVHVPVEVTKYVDRPYPVQVPVPQPVPYPVDRIVERIVKEPYPVRVPVEVKVPYPVEKQQQQQQQQLPHFFQLQLPATYGVPLNYQVPSLQITQRLNPIKNIANYRVQEQQLSSSTTTSQQQTNNGYLPPRATPCDQPGSHSSINPYYTIKPDDYIGLQPPRPQQNPELPRKFRNARSNFNSNLRVEYGFMPPLIPSLEIDENGQPLDKTHK